jgi:hypothetical protein
MVRRTVLAVVVLLLVPVLAAGATSGPSTGVLGLVKQAQGGTCLADDPCDGIARDVELVFSRAGHAPRRVRSNGDGGFRVLLKPGRYTVRAAVDPAKPVSPSALTVPLKGFVRVTLVIGTGAHRISAPGR